MLCFVEKCAVKGIPIGTFVETVDQANRYRDMGVSYIFYTVDVGMMFEATRDVRRAFD